MLKKSPWQDCPRKEFAVNETRIKAITGAKSGETPADTPTPMWKENLYSLMGIALGMGIVCFISLHFAVLYLMPALASSAIMLFMSYNNVFAQPRNVIGGHLMAVLAAIIVGQLFGPHWWAVAIVTVLAAFLMIITNTIHPPGGGTAIAAFLGCYSPLILMVSVMLGTVIMVLAALFINNAISSRKYPLFWF